ncbi:uncharacterized protein L3040_000910 [Drepanopeziza brunnea f. sp. 'multigermtubi']|uniref:Chalcone-flavanone isomerase n=1 Tax=Marssonina brunnea f. sp. multigermtubi (strain MB_m1) TaxID=1072389 RepID=K1WT33_MARBU|nr:chalcone-flavanone isomerase [Drepanopeziza brunnea f. sp. 'multigermtubi' MB_m1]EKD20805.1 chalcone-flavanone isomerase [Drepanopeziza brunnea f. sp. 'multigermtubi' MB_m1]KAJ5054643.1 hypothetical protein L3040_000910 [Drepanopeziza brunnea f. sp. 'multigermtubi']
MSLHKSTLRFLRPELTLHTKCFLRPSPRSSPLLTRTPTRTQTISSKAQPQKRAPVDPITLHRLEAERRAYYKRRSYYAGAGVVIGMIAIYVTAIQVPLTHNLDSFPGRASDPLVALGRERKIVVQKLGEEPEEVPDVVKTGTSTIPTFPRVLEFVDDERVDLPEGGAEVRELMDEYQLLGLGVRTVTFLGVEVYVVGIYVATDDIAALQRAFIAQIAKGASSLVKGEKEELKRKLFDKEEGVRIWSEVLEQAGVRTLVRIVPCKNTDFKHLRDAWVRSLTNKANSDGERYGDEAFGEGVAELKKLLNRGSMPKGKELLLSRDGKGRMAGWYDDGKTGAVRLGSVADERISRVVWLNYLAGQYPASEPARKSIVDGVMEFVERPVGTVATQVQVQTHV